MATTEPTKAAPAATVGAAGVKAPSSVQAVVTTVEGKVVSFYDFVSKFIVLHPKTSVITASIVSLVIGRII